MSNDKMKDAWEVYWLTCTVGSNYNDTKAGFESGWQACAEAMQQDQQEPEWLGMDQDWKGMDGETAFWLIQRHADGWDQLGAMMDAWLEANKVQQDATTLRQAIVNIHDRILRGDSDAELMAMCDAALGGTGINGLTREEESQTASVMGLVNRDHIPDAGGMVKVHVADALKLVQSDDLRQILTDPENQPNQFGIRFSILGPKMVFSIGGQSFTLDYEPSEPGDFEFMRDMLIHAMSIFTPDVKVPAKRLSDDEIDIMTTAMWGKQLGVIMQAHRTYARTIEAKILGVDHE